MTYNFLIHEPNGNLPTPNNSRTVLLLYRIYVFTVSLYLCLPTRKNDQ